MFPRVLIFHGVQYSSPCDKDFKLGTTPSSATTFACDFEQVTQPSPRSGPRLSSALGEHS